MAIKQIKKNCVSNEVFEQIKENIINGEWKPGDKIPAENELKDMFGISRNSVRTALQKLIALGILSSKQGEGTFVSDLSPGMFMNALIPMLMLDNDGLLEILEFRQIIETESVKLAAQRATVEDIEALAKLVEAMNIMVGDNYHAQTFAETDSDFHEMLVKCARNSVLMKVYMIIRELLLSNQMDIQRLMGPALAFKYHPMILDAIKRRDQFIASELMKEHIEATIENIKNMEINIE